MSDTDDETNYQVDSASNKIAETWTYTIFRVSEGDTYKNYF